MHSTSGSISGVFSYALVLLVLPDIARVCIAVVPHIPQEGIL